MTSINSTNKKPDKTEMIIKLANLKDSEIDYSDIPEVNYDQLLKAKNKYKSVKIDTKIITKYQKKSKHYIKLINKVLNDYLINN